MADEWWDENGWGEKPDTGRREGTRPRFDWMGFDRQERGLADRDDHRASAPDVPLKLGMTVDELLKHQQEFTAYARSRLGGVGAQQYDRGGAQQFEYMDPDELVQGLREELADIINYAVMIDIQVQRFLPQYWKARDHG